METGLGVSGQPQHMRGWLLAVLFGLIVSDFATLASAQSYQFSTVDVLGNQRVDASTILAQARIPRGQVVSAADLNDAFRRVTDSGLFESVELVPRGSRLTIVVEEFPTINQISFEGNRRLSDEVLFEAIRSQSRRVYSPAQAEADAARIAEGYLQAGRLAATVDPKIIRRSDNRVDLVFEITEGRVAEVERLSFVGNSNYSDYRLRRVLGTKQAGLFRAFIQADTLLEERIAADRQLLTDFYTSRGYIDFQVLSATPELLRNRRGYVLTFNVREGQQFRVGDVSVSSDLPSVNTAEYRAALRLKPGVVYSPTLVENDIVRLERLAVQNRENFIRIEPRVTRNDRTLTLDIDFVVSRGPRVFVERIDIEGNTSTLDRVVRREFDTVEGDPFNPRAIRNTAERIRALGYFGDANVEAREGSSPDTVIVDVDVEEAPTGSLGFGATYSTSSGAGFNIAFSERNFLGRGQGLSVDLSVTSSRLNFGIDFVEPAFLGRDVTFGLAASYRETNSDNSRFNTRSAVLSPRLVFPLDEATRLGVNFSLAYSEVFDIDRGFPDDSTDRTDTGSSAILRAEEDMGGLLAFSLGYDLTYDTRLIGLDPTSGLQFRVSTDIGVREDANFIRSEMLLRARRSILNEDVTLRAELEAGAIRFFGGDSRVVERYNLNGKIRGFESNGLGPRDLNVTNEDPLGGNAFAVARFEADFPLGLPEEYGISGGVFYDIGSVWGLDNVGGGPGGGREVDDDLHWRSAAGFSLFWDTAIGPLRFNFSRPIMKEEYDREQNFEFTVSTRF